MKKKFQNTILAVAIFMAAAISADAQTKKCESIFQFGAGLSVADPYNYRGGLGTSASYGLDIYVSPSFSFMPAVAVHGLSESIIRSGFDIDLDDFYFTDLSVGARYHFGKCVLGVAPYVALGLNDDKFVTDKYKVEPAEGDSFLDGKSEILRFDYGFIPSFSYNIGNHLSIGFQLYWGLRDVHYHYDQVETGSRYLYSGLVTLGIRL